MHASPRSYVTYVNLDHQKDGKHFLTLIWCWSHSCMATHPLEPTSLLSLALHVTSPLQQPLIHISQPKFSLWVFPFRLRPF
ncbi:hypothetical protein VNO77_29025 [Canavalia gladiata]|uniref:Uncharacterized protein n=1 Tax=Canavalia gladiata TaxID=3824 RepID=A0AAN9KYY6_CANGL